MYLWHVSPQWGWQAPDCRVVRVLAASVDRLGDPRGGEGGTSWRAASRPGPPSRILDHWAAIWQGLLGCTALTENLHRNLHNKQHVSDYNIIYSQDSILRNPLNWQIQITTLIYWEPIFISVILIRYNSKFVFRLRHNNFGNQRCYFLYNQYPLHWHLVNYASLLRQLHCLIAVLYFIFTLGR